ncbi:MAG: sigma 54-interacting transcriptional regulator [Deltaproteobacteria bacterium]|nr:sigma 54-interacting transcriptional regulator [Deltaproteobacteria bacterium]
MVAHCEKVADREGLLEEAVSAIMSSLELPELLERTSSLLRRHFGATRVAINRWQPDEPLVAEVLLADDPKHPTPPRGTRFPLEGSVPGRTIRTRKPLMVDHLGTGPSEFLEVPELARLGYGALASFPLMVGEQILGTLDIAHPAPQGLLHQCFRAAEQVAQLIAISLHNSLMVGEINRLNQLLSRENARLKDQIRLVLPDDKYIAESPAMAAVVEEAHRVGPSETTVFVRGETGTGKEGLARLVHECSRRAAGPFVPVNLGAIPESLIESELFGHEKGAFSGALKRKIGRFELAQGGTLFLDEVGDAPPGVQVKLLRAVQEREIMRVGGEDPIQVDFRLVAATNRPLEAMVDEGAFRSDLYYRLNIYPIHLPPLRERAEDLRPLVEHLVERHSQRLNRLPPELPDELWAALASYHWPGNVRELENYVERALLLSRGDTLVIPDLPTAARHVQPGATPTTPSPANAPFDAQVRRLLQRALEQTSGRVYGPEGAAKLLGLKPTTLQGKLKRYGLR